MSELNHLASSMEMAFSNPESTSFAHFVIVSDGLTAAQAASVPMPRFNSVWAVTNHVALWQDLLRAGLLGQPLNLAAWGLSEIGAGWPALGEVTDAAWLAARQRALDINHELAVAIQALGEDQLEQPLAHFFNVPAQAAILSIFSHNSYHTAEIISIRHMQGFWVDHPWV
jgi:DinB superfamily